MKSTTGGRNKYPLFAVLIALLAASFAFSLIFGGSRISINDLYKGVLSPSGIEETIIWKIRIPRIILGILIGAGLSTAGATLQGILRNPLADPYTLGISGGAAFGAAAGALLGTGALGMPVFAFLGAMLSVFLVYSVASRKYFSVPTLILGGVILSFLFSAMVLLIFSLSRTDKMYSTMLWLMGDLSNTGSGMIKTAGAFVLAGIAALWLMSREIDVLTLGEEKAAHLGIEPGKRLKIIFVIVSLITGACVASSGIIGFVGLIIPHFIRKFTGAKHSLLIPASAMAGAIFLCLADALARSIIYPVELPAGVITGIFGGIFFLYFLLRAKEWEIF